MALSVAWNTPRYASIERTYAAMSTAHSKQTCNLFLGRPRTTQLQYNHYNYCLPFKMGLDNNRLYLLRGSHWLYHIRRTWGEFLRTVSSHFSRTYKSTTLNWWNFCTPVDIFLAMRKISNPLATYLIKHIWQKNKYSKYWNWLIMHIDNCHYSYSVIRVSRNIEWNLKF